MKKDRNNLSEISLFPFLSVLVSLLGVLIMITLATSAISLGAGKTVRISIKKSDMKLSMDPTYIEWDGISIRIHPENLRIPAFEAFDDNGNNTSLFGQLLNRIEENKSTQYIIIAVRPSGFHNFYQLRNIIINHGIKIGYEPIEQRWDITVGKEEKSLVSKR